jgi:hypothetical protein
MFEFNIDDSLLAKITTSCFTKNLIAASNLNYIKANSDTYYRVKLADAILHAAVILHLHMPLTIFSTITKIRNRNRKLVRAKTNISEHFSPVNFP